MVADVKELMSSAEDMNAFRVASMGVHLNTEGGNIDLSSLKLWNAKVVNRLFPLFYNTQREHDAYVQNRLRDMVEMLNDSRTNWSTDTTFDHFPLNDQMLTAFVTLLRSKLPGSQPIWGWFKVVRAACGRRRNAADGYAKRPSLPSSPRSFYSSRVCKT